jgi:hypothetical protein
MGDNEFEEISDIGKEKEFSDNAKRSMAWGSACEQANMDTLFRGTGASYRHLNLFLESSVEPRLGATLDGLLRPGKGLKEDRFVELCSRKKPARKFVSDLQAHVGTCGVIEMKQSDWRSWDSEYNKKKLKQWTEDCPPMYYWQVQTQLLVTGLDWGVIVCRLGAADWRGHVILADAFAHEEILTAVEEYYANRVREDETSLQEALAQSLAVGRV